ncbi:hypothetical protein P280DRAFT_25175 [Massarina eburnea CBS 473.64]|uniref:Uncharacterized protein n=1 Tax=Massarina eburnea CBS 473.64 TaxID=1395130 RepID=A0A6A6RWP8_9PLEO|nr:hypothetical protein P280DRAFT_25175 [Massarina eburnea CBS 473.64]
MGAAFLLNALEHSVLCYETPEFLEYFESSKSSKRSSCMARHGWASSSAICVRYGWLSVSSWSQQDSCPTGTCHTKVPDHHNLLHRLCHLRITGAGPLLSFPVLRFLHSFSPVCGGNWSMLLSCSKRGDTRFIMST